MSASSLLPSVSRRSHWNPFSAAVCLMNWSSKASKVRYCILSWFCKIPKLSSHTKQLFSPIPYSEQ